VISSGEYPSLVLPQKYVSRQEMNVCIPVLSFIKVTVDGCGLFRWRLYESPHLVLNISGIGSTPIPKPACVTSTASARASAQVIIVHVPIKRRCVAGAIVTANILYIFHVKYSEQLAYGAKINLDRHFLILKSYQG